MNKQFIVLTTPENTEIIIGLSTIAIIRIADGNRNMTEITFNFIRNNGFEPKTIVVKEEFGLVKSMLGLK